MGVKIVVLFVVLSVATSGCLWWGDDEDPPEGTGEPWPEQPVEPASTDTARATPTPSPSPPTPTPAAQEPAPAAEDTRAPASGPSAAPEPAPATNTTAASNATNTTSSSTANATANNTSSNATPNATLDHAFVRNVTVSVTQTSAAPFPFGGPAFTSSGGCIQILANATKNATTSLKGGFVTATWEAAPGGAESFELAFYARGNATATRVSGYSPLSLPVNATLFDGSASAPRLTVGLPSSGAPTAAFNQQIVLSVALDVIGEHDPRVQTC